MDSGGAAHLSAMSEPIPTANRLPIVGSALAVGRDPFGFLERASSEHGPVFRVSIPGLSFVCYTDPDLVERALVTERGRYRKDPRERELLGDFLGDGLVTARGETWERGREAVGPAFYPGRIREYGAVMVEEAAALAAGWDDGERVDAYAAARDLTLTIVARTLFGIDRLAERDVVAETADAVTRRFEPSSVPVEVPLWVPTPANRRYRRAVEDFEAVLDRLLEESRAAEPSGEASGGSNGAKNCGSNSEARGDEADRSTLVATLLSAVDAGDLTEGEVRDQLTTMLFAGHETTAIALTYSLALLATHPEERARVCEEVRAAEALTPTTDLPRVDRVVRETLRLYPPAYMTFRQTTEPDTVAGYEIPAGTRVVLPQWSLHRDPRYYDEPLEFRPDRWTTELRNDLPEYAYFPFGGGPRACIGRRFALLELRLALAAILRAVDLEALPETDVSPTPALTCRPGGPVWLRVRR